MNILKEMSLRRRLSSSSASTTELNEDVPSLSSGKRWKKTTREKNGYASLRRSNKLLPRSKTTSHDLGDLLYPRRVYIPHSTTLISMSSRGERSSSNISKVPSDWSYCRPPPKPSAANLASQNQSQTQSKSSTRRVQESISSGCEGVNYEERHFFPEKSLLDHDGSCIVEDFSFSSRRPFITNKPDLTDAGGDLATRNQDPLPDYKTRLSFTAISQLRQQQCAIDDEVEEDPSEGKSSSNFLVIENQRICPNPLSRSCTTKERLSATKSHCLFHDGDNQKPLLSLPLQSYSSSSSNTLSPCSSSNSATTSNSILRMHQLPQYTNTMSQSSSLISFKAAKAVTLAVAAKDDLELDVDTQAERLYLLHDFVNTQEKITQARLIDRWKVLPMGI